MKKTLLILSSLILPSMAIAEAPAGCSWDKTIYAIKMSPNGKWIGSMAGDAAVFNVQTSEKTNYADCFLGLGNTVADNGMAVGDSNEAAVVMFNGKQIYPETTINRNFCAFNAITPDATRVCGLVNPEKRGEVTVVPFVASIDPATGEVGELIELPYPSLDFFGAAPQFVTAVWISADGKCVVGQVQDWRGGYSYPIVFNEATDGTWSYNLPSKQLFNPTHIELPVNPWLNEPPFPEPEDFMSGLLLQAYQDAYNAYINGWGDNPIPEEYMTQAQYDAYAEAVETYNEWFEGSVERQKQYIRTYNEVLKTSPSFSDNDLAIDPNGKFMMIRGGVENNDGDMIGKIYRFSTTDNSYEIFDLPNESLCPRLILSDGTVFASTPQMEVPTSYIMLPGEKEFTPIFDYFKTNYPVDYAWLQEEFPNGSGEVCTNNDMTVFAGALIPGQLKDYDYDGADFFYSSWIVNLDPTGVESIVADPEDGIYRVFNLQGVKVLETKDAAEVDGLGKGLYIINGKKVIK